jgi:hypothetical protein
MVESSRPEMGLGRVDTIPALDKGARALSETTPGSALDSILVASPIGKPASTPSRVKDIRAETPVFAG